MAEVMEPEIKLFGRTIVLLDRGISCHGNKCLGMISDESGDGRSRGVNGDRSVKQNGVKEVGGGIIKVDEEKQKLAGCEKDKASGEISEDKGQNQGAGPKIQSLNATTDQDDNPTTPSIDEDAVSTSHPKSDNEQSDGANAQQKILKKPDKILPCPRCDSMDTKFCYYNNYNVSQPRHFCKSCQRYWTAGGTMRNIPVGAGRRKNKSPPSNCHHIMISEALQASIIDGYNGFHRTTIKPNDTVLSFGPDSPLCKSMAPALKIDEKSMTNDVGSGHDSDQVGLLSCRSTGDNGDDCSTGSSIKTSNSDAIGSQNGLQQPMIHNLNPLQAPVPCIPGVPWQFPWNSVVPLPAIFSPPGFQMPFYPPQFWNCGLPDSWNAPWLSVPSPTASQRATSCSPNSTLGKHSRNGELINRSSPAGEELSGRQNSESSIVVPKTLRINDPEEAAKSSIWETLGIKYDSSSREGLLKALQPKCDQKKPMVNARPGLLQANPAALSRSISFQESA